jgi:hypothetical protein
MTGERDLLPKLEFDRRMILVISLVKNIEERTYQRRIGRNRVDGQYW